MSAPKEMTFWLIIAPLKMVWITFKIVFMVALLMTSMW